VFGLTIEGLVANAIALLVGFTVHEASHALVAYLLGDDTAKRQGRLSLNPLVHLDPLGAIMALLLRFGWAKPTPVSPWRLRYGPRVGGALVALAGPVSNLLLAILAGVLWRLAVANIATLALPQWALLLLFQVLGTLVVLNLLLFIFNLIPLAPLDGNSILNGIVGARLAHTLAPLQMYGPQILMGLMLISFILPQFNILGRLLYPAGREMARLVGGQTLAYMFFG
jgi:Zn-dependent protease